MKPGPPFRRIRLVLALACVAAALVACSGGSPGPPPTPDGAGQTQPTATDAPRRPAGQFPDRASTGVPAGTVLVEFPGDLNVTRRGQVVEGMRITGDIRVKAQDVIIRDSEVLGRVVNQDGNGNWRYTIEDSTVGRADGCYKTGDGSIGIDNYVARRVFIHGFSDGFRISGDHVVIEDSLVTLCDSPGAHADGVQGYGAGNDIRIIGNTIDGRAGDSENSAIFFADGSLGATVQDNLLLGGGWTLGLHDEDAQKKPRNMADFTVTGNRFADGTFGYGPISVDDCDQRRSIVWSDNLLVTVDDSYRVTEVKDPIRC